MPDDFAGSETLRSPPFGIDRRHFEPRSPGWLRTLLIALLIGLPLLAALLGFLGGRETVRSVRGAEAVLTVATPHILRSGNWFETQIIVEAATDIEELAIAIDQPLWRGMSIDTAIPDAEKVETLDGRFTYSFGPLAGGERFLLKLDGQIQPRGPRELSGSIAVLDGERRLAALPLTIRVLP